MRRLPAILEVSGLVKSFGGVTAVDDVTFNVEKGAIHGLIGPNGSGKTVTFDCITGYSRPDKGLVMLKGGEITGRKPHTIVNAGLGRSFQITAIYPKLTVLENLRFATQAKGLKTALGSFLRSIAGMRDAMDEERINEVLQFGGLAHLRDERAGNLSYGQQRILEFISLLVTRPEPDILLLDEPTAGIRGGLVTDFMGMIKQLNEQGKTFLVVEHNMRVIMNICHTITVLNHGHKIAEGKPEEIRDSTAVIDAYLGR